ncbi:MAG TPA: cell division protein CrgA [Acidimicrobiia bacterium]|nr:cell division protein CrgA [Acidimicrobiia bacterium]
MPKSKGRRRPSRVDQPPPIPEKAKVSPTWYAVLMFGLMAVGVLVIILNYIGIVPGGEQQSIYLYLGLAAIGVGFMMTLNYH